MPRWPGGPKAAGSPRRCADSSAADGAPWRQRDPGCGPVSVAVGVSLGEGDSLLLVVSTGVDGTGVVGSVDVVGEGDGGGCPLLTKIVTSDPAFALEPPGGSVLATR